MAKRYTIGLNYFFDNQSNSGIVNYIYNIIAALNTIDDAKKPALVVFFSPNAPVDYLKSIGYPFIRFMPFKPSPSGRISSLVNRLVKRVLSIDLYKKYTYYNKIDSLYPCFEIKDYNFGDFKNRVFWLVDFNNRAFPQHYNDNGANMQRMQGELAASGNTVILSSNALLNELKQYYPLYACNVKLLRFASSLPKLNYDQLSGLKQKHGISTPYFMSPNQLWEHKNQSVVLDAINLIKQAQPGLEFKVLFSGSLEVNRGKGHYITKLLDKVNDFGLEQYVSFMGVLDRQEQLLLMAGSDALLQPSLYEGWSTLVEEAKALNKFILLSDLPVHREQINTNVDFFDPHDAQQLADKMVRQLREPAEIQPLDYANNIRSYASDILQALTIS